LGAKPVSRQIVFLPTFDWELSVPEFVYAVIAKYHVPVFRLPTT
jgi:hypothetical protein